MALCHYVIVLLRLLAPAIPHKAGGGCGAVLGAVISLYLKKKDKIIYLKKNRIDKLVNNNEKEI